MINLKQAIADSITASLKKARRQGLLSNLKDMPAVVVDRQDSNKYGDYASPIALTLAAPTKIDPMKIIKIIVAHMSKDEYIGRIKAVHPGYLNIWLNPGWMTARLDNLIQQNICADINIGAGQSVNLEFISANPTGPLTLGNIRSAFTADTLGNILECAGYNVTREYYFNDSGAQIKKLGESIIRRYLQQNNDIEYGPELYQGDYINDLADQVAETLRENKGEAIVSQDLNNEQKNQSIGRLAATILMDDIKKTLRQDLRVNFDIFTSESDLRAKGKVKQVIERLKTTDLVYRRRGVVWLKTTASGDSQDRVLVKSDGEYAYVAPDIAYHQDKYDRGFDQIFTFVGADHQGHLPKIKAAMAALGNDTNKLHQVVNQWMKIVRNGQLIKLSKRAGNIVTPQDLIAAVGYDATRFFMVQHQLNNHLNFDIGLAKEKSEQNPVYYVQYAYVRLQSILRQAKQRGVINQVGITFDLSDSPALTHTLELALMRQLYRLPEVISDITNDFEAHKLTYYAVDLAKAIHVFYRHVPVLADQSKRIVDSRLQLVLAAREIMGKTLDLIGISKPEVM